MLSFVGNYVCNRYANLFARRIWLCLANESQAYNLGTPTKLVRRKYDEEFKQQALTMIRHGQSAHGR